MENPGALAGATGANVNADEHREKFYRKANRGAMARFAKDRHKRAARVLGYALTADAPDSWAQASQLFAARLTRLELASLAFSTLRALPPEDRALIASAADWVAEA